MSAANGTGSGKVKDDKGKAKVETSKVTVTVSASSGKKVKRLEPASVHYQRIGGTNAQSTPSVNPEVSGTHVCVYQGAVVGHDPTHAK